MKRKGDHFPFVLVHQGMHPFLAKLQAILEVCELENKSELQSFLVLLYPDYVNIGESTEPINVKGLSVVLEKGVPSFISSSQRHTPSSNVFAHYNPKLEVQLAVHASPEVL